MSISFKGDYQIIEDMKEYYHSFMCDKKVAYSQCVFKTDEYIITIYESNKILFQGKKAQEEADRWFKDVNLFNQSNTNQTNLNNSSLDYQNQYIPKLCEKACIGSDEVGTGSYFGPVVVCACFLDQTTLNEISMIDIKDSKKLSDKDILRIAPKLMDKVVHYLYILDNIKYNEAIKNNNLNVIKAKMHNYALLQLIKKIGYQPQVIVDQFCLPKNYYQYLNDTKNVVTNIHFETKAEDKYLVVAIASIIARYAFLEEMDTLGKSLNTVLKGGAGSNVDIQAKELVEKHGVEILEKIAKLHFANTKKIINLFNQ